MYTNNNLIDREKRREMVGRPPAALIIQSRHTKITNLCKSAIYQCHHINITPKKPE